MTTYATNLTCACGEPATLSKIAQCFRCYQRDYKRKRRQDPAFRELQAERMRRTRAEDRDHVNKLWYAWAARNPDRVALYQERRREAIAAGDLTPEQWEAILVAHGHACAYCGRDDLPLTTDHVTPISMGGKHTASNVKPACRPCNSRKGART